MAELKITKENLLKWSGQNPSPTQLDQATLKLLGTIAHEVWEHNNKYMLDNDGRPYGDKDNLDLDSDKNLTEYNTYSESIGYKLLREVLMGIKARKTGNKVLENKTHKTFEKVWNWTTNNMVRKNIGKVYDIGNKKWIKMPARKKDSLLAWRWVPSITGNRGGIIHSVSSTPRKKDGVWVDGLDGAPDADLFVIAALRMAAILWHKKPQKNNFLKAAKEMTVDARKKYITKISGEHYLLGGDEYYKVNGVNPSYAFEAIYDMLSELDPKGKQVWQEVKKTSLKVAILGADATLHRKDGTKIKGTINVPPNWLVFDGNCFGDMPWFDFRDWIMGWDGARTLWMKGAYYLYNHNPIAKKYLTDNAGTVKDFGPYAFLKTEYKKHGMIQSGYGIDGTKTSPQMQKEKLGKESPFTNGIYLGYFYAAGDKEMTLALIKKLKAAYQADDGDKVIEAKEGTFEIFGKVESDNYFSDHWAWFGVAMASGMMEDYFNVYKAWRRHQGLPATQKENMQPKDFQVTSAALQMEKKSLNLASWWNFDGCKKNPDNTFSCKGNAKAWYLGGTGGMMGDINPYSGVFVNVEGKAGRVKIELHGKDGKLYTYEVVAISAENLYIPFDKFREEINYQPAGKQFSKSIGAEKIQIIALGTSGTSPINFALKEVGLVKKD